LNIIVKLGFCTYPVYLGTLLEGEVEFCTKKMSPQVNHTAKSRKAKRIVVLASLH
jgi:hypothetical protein